MEEEVMYKIYNNLFDSKKELEIEDIEIYRNLEQSLVIKYKYKGEFYLITNELLNV